MLARVRDIMHARKMFDLVTWRVHIGCQRVLCTTFSLFIGNIRTVSADPFSVHEHVVASYTGIRIECFGQTYTQAPSLLLLLN